MNNARPAVLLPARYVAVPLADSASCALPFPGELSTLSMKATAPPAVSSRDTSNDDSA